MKTNFGLKGDYFEAVNELNKVLDDMDDRGLILSIAAFAEEALGYLLTSYFLDEPASLQLTNGFNAPLGSRMQYLKRA
jgi:hypothetical protein